MIPVEHKQEIIASGINFMRSITEAYGSDEGMKLWDSIASVLDPDVKGQIFFALLTGDYNGIVMINSFNSTANRVAMIKAIRTVDRRMPGLKEAKDMVDDLIAKNKAISLEINPRHRIKVLDELRYAGFNV
jgi:hypothetical protein